MPAIDTLTPAEEKFFSSKGEVAPEPELPLAEAPKEETPEPEKAAAEPAVVEEVDPDDAEEVIAETGKNATKVSIGALHKERKLRKAAETAAAEQKLENAKIASRIEVVQQLIQQSQQPQRQPGDDIPDVNEDPVGHFRAKVERLEAQEAQRTQQVTAITNVQRLGQIATEKEAEYIRANPDYNDASKFLQEARAAQLRIMGYDQQTIAQTMSQEAIQLAAAALQRGENPAKWVHEMAKAMGHKGAPKAQIAPEPTADEVKIAMAAKGQGQGAGLGQIAGTASTPTTLEGLLKMSDSEFAEATKGDKFRKLLEGKR